MRLALTLGLALALGMAPLVYPGPALGDDERPEEEEPLEGEAKEQYDAERKAHLKKLRRFRERADLLAYIEKLSKRWSRAGRDALMTFTAKTKDSEVLAHAFYHLIASKDPVAIRFVCGADGILSRREETQIRAFNALWRAKSPAIAGPILDVLDNRRMNIDIKVGLIGTIAEYAGKDERVLAALMAYATNGKHQVRTEALEGLGAARNAAATDLLLSVISKAKSSQDRESAWIGLADTGRHDLLPQLRRVAQSERQANVREAAGKTIAALEKLVPPEPASDKKEGSK